MPERPPRDSTMKTNQQAKSGRDRYRELQEIADLYESGRISDREFRRRKRRVLRGPVPATDQLELIVASFWNESEAEASLCHLQNLQRDGNIVIVDATVVGRERTGGIRIQELRGSNLAKDAAVDGLAELLFAPLAGASHAEWSTLDGVFQQWFDVGFSETDLTAICDKLEPGQSAIFAIVYNLQADRIASEFEGFAAFSRHHLGRHAVRIQSGDWATKGDDE